MLQASHADRHSPQAIGFILLVCLIALAAGTKAVFFDTLDPDLFWHLRVADALLANGIGPLVDDLSFASIKDPWTPYSWLAELAMRQVWQFGDYRATILVQAILASSLIFFIALACIERARADSEEVSRLSIALTCAFAAFLSLPCISFRPATFALVILAACVWLIHRDRRLGYASRAVWCIVPLTALLTNIHLYVILVPALLASVLVDHFRARRPLRRPIVLLLTASLAALMTPMLPGVVSTIFHYQFSDPMVDGPFIHEMQPIWSSITGICSLLLIAAWFIRCYTRRESLQLADWLFLAMATILLMRFVRFAPLFAIVALPVLASVAPRLSDNILAKPILQTVLGLLIVVGLLRAEHEFPGRSFTLEQWVNRHGPDVGGYPCAAADFLQQHVPHSTGRIINDFTWGGFLAWRLNPQYTVLLDGRTQLYTPDFWQYTYLGDDSQRISFLQTVNADAAILARSKSPFRQTLLDQGWRIAYSDPLSEVLLPPSPSFAHTE